MSQKLASIESDALALPVRDRAVLAEHLIASLEVGGGKETTRLKSCGSKKQSDGIRRINKGE